MYVCMYLHCILPTSHPLGRTCCTLLFSGAKPYFAESNHYNLMLSPRPHWILLFTSISQESTTLLKSGKPVIKKKKLLKVCDLGSKMWMPKKRELKNKCYPPFKLSLFCNVTLTTSLWLFRYRGRGWTWKKQVVLCFEISS
jgi:hypothetical protein